MGAVPWGKGALVIVVCGVVAMAGWRPRRLFFRAEVTTRGSPGREAFRVQARGTLRDGASLTGRADIEALVLGWTVVPRELRFSDLERGERVLGSLEVVDNLPGTGVEIIEVLSSNAACLSGVTREARDASARLEPTPGATVTRETVTVRFEATGTRDYFDERLVLVPRLEARYG